MALSSCSSFESVRQAVKETCAREAKVEIVDPVAWEKYARDLRAQQTGQIQPIEFLVPGPLDGYQSEPVPAPLPLSAVEFGRLYEKTLHISKDGKLIAKIRNFYAVFDGLSATATFSCVNSFSELYGLVSGERGRP